MHRQLRPRRPARYDKPWGFEDWIVNLPEFCGKILHYDWVGERTSWHYHRVKKESFMLLSGKFLIIFKDVDSTDRDNRQTADYLLLEPGDVFDLEVGDRHQLITLSDNADLLEVSTEHKEQDSIRLIAGTDPLDPWITELIEKHQI